MKRTTISLPDDVAAALEREARRRRVPVSQVAREAIEAKLGWEDEESPFASLIGMFNSAEAADSSDLDTHGMPLSEYVDSDEFKKEFADWIERDAFNRDP